MNLRAIISNRRKALKQSTPKNRDKLRHQLRVAEVAALLRRKSRAA